MTCRLLYAALLLTLSAAAREIPAPTAVLKLDSGPITGVVIDAEAGVRAYKGIPFAAPPVGHLRWRPPQPVAPWTAPRTCDSFGPMCPQPDVPLLVPKKEGNRSEDCLYLNVWTTAKPGAKRPVMVWIHGGGCTIGAGSLPVYDGTDFARDGVVLVTINYRLGPFGFLAHPGLSRENPNKVSGNYGLLDQIAALKWVRRNIKVFGGDPNNVTVFGESAGGVCINALLVSPPARGLFQRAIMQSGTAVGVRQHLNEGRKTAAAQGLRIARDLNAANVDELRQKTAAELLRAARPRVGFLGKGTAFGPIIDGFVLPDAPVKLMAAGKAHPVPVMLGTNADEATLFASQMPVRKALGYRLVVRMIYQNDAKSVLKLFPVKPGQDPKPQLYKLVTVSAFVAPTRVVARLAAKQGMPTYLYHFSRVAPAAKQSGMGATHGIEIPYLFGTSKRLLREDTDLELSRRMRRYWIQFAASGKPDGDGLPAWPAYTAAKDQHLEFGNRITVGRNLMQEECDFFTRLTAKKYGVPLP